MKKVLITGSNGLLGQKLVALLAGKTDYQVLATARGTNRLGKIGNHYQYTEMDITNPNEVEKVISYFKPDYIIHTAAMTNVDQCESDREGCTLLNVKATEHLIASAKKTNSFFIHLSTDFIFDGTKGPLTEEDLPNPISFYGKSKLDAERCVASSNLRWAIARTVLVYGVVKDMSRSNLILWVKKSLEEKKTINVVDDQWRTPTLAEDLAMGCFLIIEKEATGIFNISGNEMLTPYEMAIKTADFFRLDKTFINRADSSTFTQPAKRPPRTGFTIDKAKNILGYNPHSFVEGIHFMQEQMGMGVIKRSL
ncbi:MAG TPA: SDR family oxidoreductase [Cytophagaceae bacterium]|jgi:dTDP-4-dehydrorhamnose reductase|nr:SDR family oxidoreductase [Cytophagaceae bacterium]